MVRIRIPQKNGWWRRTIIDRVRVAIVGETALYPNRLQEQIPNLKKNRRATDFAGCLMCHGLFIRADNKLPCSCLTGYYTELGDIARDDLGKFVEGPIVSYIRSSFCEGYEPFPMCNQCACRESFKQETGLALSVGAQESQGFLLHVEPANICNLYCEACLCTSQRKSAKPLPRNLLDFSIFKKALSELRKANVVPEIVTFAGYGEPLLNPHVPSMASLARDLFPSSLINLDTNANHRPQLGTKIADCGFDVIRLGLDGPDQATYEAYRNKGLLAMGLRFAEALVNAVKEKGSKTRPVWKYILFRHNDRDDQILKAISLADRIGLEIEFDYTVGPLASSRDREGILRVIGSRKVGANIDRRAFHED